MAAISTKGISIHLSKGGVAATELVPTAISSAKPAVVTVASVANLAKGDVVKMEGTGFKELDGKTFTIGTIVSAANTFELTGSNTTGTTGTLGATPKAHVYRIVDSVKLCLASIDFSTSEGSTVSTGTFCDPSASIATPATTAGTMSLTGYVNAADPDYAELLVAEADGATRMLSIELPQNNGYIVAPVTISSVSWQTPLEGAIGYTFSGSLGSKPVHLF
jgi:hypothetical protein